MLNGTQEPDCISESAPVPAVESETNPFFNPYLQILVSICLSAAAQLFLKRGVDQSIPVSASFGLGFAALHSKWVLAGIACLISSLVFWLYALRSVQLIIAFNLAGLTHVIIPLVSWFWLGEKVGGIRWLGIALVFAGVLIVAQPIIKLEEK